MQPVTCTECGIEADDNAHGWRAYLADDPRDDEPAETAVYCPACAAREFSAQPRPAQDAGT